MVATRGVKGSEKFKFFAFVTGKPKVKLKDPTESGADSTHCLWMFHS